MTEEEINEFYVAVEGVYDVSFTEEEKLKLYRLLEKFGFHKAKVFENIKKNKLYYRKYIDGLTGNWAQKVIEERKDLIFLTFLWRKKFFLVKMKVRYSCPLELVKNGLYFGIEFIEK